MCICVCVCMRTKFSNSMRKREKEIALIQKGHYFFFFPLGWACVIAQMEIFEFYEAVHI